MHPRRPGSGSAETAELLPGLHTAVSQAKRWLLTTHQRRVEDAHPPDYLSEFVFRFSHRRSRHGLLCYRLLAVGH